MTLRKRVEQLEKKMADIERQLNQPSTVSPTMSRAEWEQINACQTNAAEQRAIG